MNSDKLAIVLTVTFVISVVILFAELLFLLRRRQVFRPQFSQPPVSGDNKSHPKNLQYFLCLKYETRVKPSETPNGNSNEYPPEDPVIDVFKLLEANRPSRVLCTIKEDDKEEVESTTMSGVDSIPATGIVSAEVDGAETVVSLPSDSPMFFTPMGSPSTDGMSSEFVSPVSRNC